MLEDLTTVYKFYGLLDLDFTLLKTIKKLGKKKGIHEELIKPTCIPFWLGLY